MMDGADDDVNDDAKNTTRGGLGGEDDARQGNANTTTNNPLYPPMDYSRIKKKRLTKDELELAALCAEFRNFYRTSPYYMHAEDDGTCAREKDEEHTLSWKEREAKKERAKANKKTTSWTLDDTVEDWMFDERFGFPAEIMEEFEHLRPKKDVKTTQTSISKTPEEEEEKTTREEKKETKKKSNTNTKNATDDTNTTSNGGKKTPAKRKSTRDPDAAAKKKTAATPAKQDSGPCQ